MDYHHKYIKYKNKYLKYKKTQKHISDDNLSRITKTDKMYSQLDNLNTKLNHEVISISLVEEIISFFKQYQNSDYDVSEMHKLEDNLMKKYISDISYGKITNLDIIQKIAAQIHKLNELDYLKWYD